MGCNDSFDKCKNINTSTEGLSEYAKQKLCTDVRECILEFMNWVRVTLYPKVCVALTMTETVFDVNLYKGEWGDAGTPASFNKGWSTSVGNIVYTAKIDGLTDTPPTTDWIRMNNFEVDTFQELQSLPKIPNMIATVKKYPRSKQFVYDASRENDTNGQSIGWGWVEMGYDFTGETLYKWKNDSNTVTDYVVIGDSTRDNSYNQSMYYYKSQLRKLGVTFHDMAASGQSLTDYLNNTDSPNINETLADITGDGDGYIIEFSLGLNDYTLDPSPQYLKSKMITTLNRFKTEKPKAFIVLVEPVPTANIDRAILYTQVYKEVSEEMSLSFIEISEAVFRGGRVSNELFFMDSTHPTHIGTRRIINYIFSRIFSDRKLLKMSIRWKEPASDTNIYNKATHLMDGKYINTIGATSNSASWACTDFIPCEDAQTWALKHFGNKSKVVMYDAAKSMIDEVKVFSEKGNDPADWKIFFTNNKDVKYFRFNITSEASWDRNSAVRIRRVPHIPTGIDMPYETHNIG